MALCNFVLTVVVVWVWFPRQDIETIRARRQELHRRTRRLLLEPIVAPWSSPGSREVASEEPAASSEPE
jgi:hypothetical protein